VRTEEVEGEMSIDPSAIAKIIVKVHAGVVDQDVERFDAPDSSLNLDRVGHVEGQGSEALIRMCEGLARTGMHALRASLQRFLNQRPPDAAIGPSNQDCFVFDIHIIFLPQRRRQARPSAVWQHEPTF
jgi:hypothetical protein